MNEDQEEKSKKKRYTGFDRSEREEGEVVKEEEKTLLHVSVATVTALNGYEATPSFS